MVDFLFAIIEHFSGDAEIAGVENAGVEIAASECNVEIAGAGKVWKAKVFKMYF